MKRQKGILEAFCKSLRIELLQLDASHVEIRERRSVGVREVRIEDIGKPDPDLVHRGFVGGIGLAKVVHGKPGRWWRGRLVVVVDGEGV